jgi:hypothetical protein
VDYRVHAGNRFLQAGTHRQVALDGVDVSSGFAAEDASAVSGLPELHHHVSAQCAGAARDQDAQLVAHLD